MGAMICKVFCDDPNRQRLKAVFTYSIQPRLLRRAQLNGVSKGGEHPLWSRAGFKPRSRFKLIAARRKVLTIYASRRCLGPRRAAQEAGGRRRETISRTVGTVSIRRKVLSSSCALGRPMIMSVQPKNFFSISSSVKKSGG